MTTFVILRCASGNGRIPFDGWLQSLDPMTRALVRARIDQVEDGDFGDVASVGEGISQLRMDFGPGYGVYVLVKGKEVHLIDGGLRETQAGDIVSAKRFWREHE